MKTTNQTRRRALDGVEDTPKIQSTKSETNKHYLFRPSKPTMHINRNKSLLSPTDLIPNYADHL